MVVPSGGRVFELYIELMGSWKVHTDYMKWKRDGDGIMEQGEYEVMVKAEKGSFHGFILSACGNISTGCRRQRFYLTFVARFHGLSRKGMQMLGFYGLTVKVSTYDKMEKEVIEEHHKKDRYTHNIAACKTERMVSQYASS
jgi:hypothetical protein